MYNVKYAGKKGTYLKSDKPPEELVCSAAKSVEIDTFRQGDPFFKSQQLDEFLPKNRPGIFDKVYERCGVVSSAGSLLNSRLGKIIDGDDYVIRFNAAPTSDYEADVGSKTSLRIVNSQVVANPTFKFLDESNFSNKVQLYSASPVLVWDPSSYNATVSSKN